MLLMEGVESVKSLQKAIVPLKFEELRNTH
jgi:hypothetical protein